MLHVKVALEGQCTVGDALGRDARSKRCTGHDRHVRVAATAVAAQSASTHSHVGRTGHRRRTVVTQHQFASFHRQRAHSGLRLHQRERPRARLDKVDAVADGSAKQSGSVFHTHQVGARAAEHA